MTRILAFMKYGSLAASTRQRLMIYEPHLRAAGFSVEYRTLLGNEHVQRLTTGQGASIPATLHSYLSRFWQLMRATDHDIVWVHYELFPYFPGAFERLARRSGKPVVIDYDDAIFHMYDASSNWLVRRLLGRKLAPLLRGASAALCGNAYLRDYASLYCDNAVILPTVVDTAVYRPREVAITDGALPVIGWIGSPSTWVYVRPLLPLLERVAKDTGARVRVVGAGQIDPADRFEGLDCVEWTEASEVAEVQAMDVGLMPLPDEPWARGKCGYKLVQYMACGLPVIASPVGVNATIVQDGVTGLLASDANQWCAALTRLIGDPELRAAMGRAGRERAVEAYSLQVHAPRLIGIMLKAAGALAPSEDPKFR